MMRAADSEEGVEVVDLGIADNEWAPPRGRAAVAAAEEEEEQENAFAAKGANLKMGQGGSIVRPKGYRRVVGDDDRMLEAGDYHLNDAEPGDSFDRESGRQGSALNGNGDGGSSGANGAARKGESGGGWREKRHDSDAFEIAFDSSGRLLQIGAETSDGQQTLGNRRRKACNGWCTGLGAEGAGRCVFGRRLVYLCAICSSLTSVLLGYDVGVMSGAKEYISPDLQLSQVQEEVVVGSLNLIAAFGGLVAGKASDSWGRKPTIALACAVFITGATIMTLSNSFGALLVGRIVTGVGVGCAMVIGPVYITELAPPDVRGMLVSLTDISINAGILFGYASSLACDEAISSESGKWRAMVGIGMLPPAAILVCLLFMPESPRWLVSQHRTSEGYAVLARILDDKQAAQESVVEIYKSVQAHDSHESSWRDVLCPAEAAVKAAMVVGIGLGFWQQASGSEAAVYYSPEVLRRSGWDGRALLVGNICVGFFKLAGEIVAFFLLDRFGRRPLFLVSSASSTLALMGVGMAFSFAWSAQATLALLCTFMFCFSVGLGPVTFVVASEIFPLRVRGKAMSLVVFVNRFMSGVIALSYESIAAALTAAGSFYMFAGISFVSIFFYYFKVPETRGKTLELITKELEGENLDPVQCHGHNNNNNEDNYNSRSSSAAPEMDHSHHRHSQRHSARQSGGAAAASGNFSSESRSNTSSGSSGGFRGASSASASRPRGNGSSSAAVTAGVSRNSASIDASTSGVRHSGFARGGGAVSSSRADLEDDGAVVVVSDHGGVTSPVRRRAAT